MKAAMKIKTVYPIEILEWRVEPLEKFLGSFNRNISYELGITKLDIFNNSFHFLVRVFLTYVHQVNGEIFKAKTESSFEIGYLYDAPTVEFLFDLINKATIEFAQNFKQKVLGTNLTYHQISTPKIDELRESIQAVIDYWDARAKKIKKDVGKRLDRFKDLPVIPAHKSYNKANFTLEQHILRKLETGQPISVEERQVFEELGEFYSELNKQLGVLDYNSFDESDIKDFKNYIHYAFNSHCLITNQVTIAGNLFRLIVNESVTNQNNSIIDTKFLTYPSLEIIKKNGKFNRGSTSNTTVLYLTETMDSALKEIHPPENKLVTVSIWATKRNSTFTQYPIEHNEQAALVNQQIAQGRAALIQLNQQQDPLLARYMDNYFNLLSREYAKPVSVENHYEYILSAIFSESIFDLEDDNPDFNYDCISYPSVGNNFITRNIAVKPNIADTEFKIIQVIEFEIVKAHYDRIPVNSFDRSCISVAEVKNYRETWNITDAGQIIW
jgi:hypothetical protein